MSEKQHVFRIDYEGVIDWVVAADKPDALRAWREYQVASGFREDEFEVDEIAQEPDDHQMRMRENEQNGGPEMSAAEWAETNGRGFLASSEW